MLLLKLKTKNFKRLTDNEFIFTEGMNFILGENGAGKSTLLRAIATAMFGVQMVPGHSDDIPTRGQTTWALELTFERGGQVYDIKRTKTSASVKCGEDLMASGNTPVTKFMEQMLGITAKDYNLLIHSRQGETNYVINYGATALQRKVEEFAGADDVEKIASASNQLRNDLVAKIDSMKATQLSNEEFSKLQEQLAEAQSDVILLEAEQVALEQETHPERPTAPEMSVEALFNKRSVYDRNLSQIEANAAARQDLVQRINSAEYEDEVDATEATSELKKLELELKAAKAHNAGVQANKALLANLNKQLADVRTELYNLEPVESEDLSGKLEEVTVDCQKQDLKVQQLQVDINRLKKSIKDGVCSLCGTKHAENLPELQDELASSQQALADEEFKLSQLALFRKEISVRQQAIARHRHKEHQLIAAQEKLLEQISEITVEDEVETGELEQKLAELSVILKNAEQISARNAKTAAEVERLQKQLNSIIDPELGEKVTDEEIEAVSAAWDKYRADVASFNEWANRYNASRTHVADALNRANSLISITSTTVKKQEEIRLLTSEYSVDSDTAKDLTKFLRDRRGEYLAQVWDSVMYHASLFLNEATKGWMTEVAIQEGKFLFREKGGWVPSVEASGAQEAFLGTALRVGLNKALYRGNSFMVFDEPTDGMREENARNLVAEISAASHQVLVITHRESDQGLANNIIEV